MRKYEQMKLEENFIYTNDQLVVHKLDFDRLKFPSQGQCLDNDLV